MQNEDEAQDTYAEPVPLVSNDWPFDHEPFESVNAIPEALTAIQNEADGQEMES
jgi:hypothetical protein